MEIWGCCIASGWRVERAWAQETSWEVRSNKLGNNKTSKAALVSIPRTSVYGYLCVKRLLLLLLLPLLPAPSSSFYWAGIIIIISSWRRHGGEEGDDDGYMMSETGC